MRWNRRFASALALSFCILTSLIDFGDPAVAQAEQLEKPDVNLVVGGTSAQLYFLPVVLADRLGYFAREGLKVTMIDAGSGAKGLQALMGGGADVTAGSFEHPIRMQARGQNIEAVVKFGRFHGNVLGITPRHIADYKSPADLKGWKIGVSAPGSSTQIFVTLLLAQHGLKPDDVSFIALGQGAGGIAAIRTGKELDAVSLTDPVVSELESTKDIIVAADSRTLKGTIEAYGGETISGVFYTTAAFAAKNPNTLQALVTAIVRTLGWIKKATIDDIMTKVPPEYLGSRPELYRLVLEKNLENFQSDGFIQRDQVAITLDFLRKTDPDLINAKIDLSKTYDNSFVERAHETVGKQ